MSVNIADFRKMTTHQLLELAKERGIDTPGLKRTGLIYKVLEDTMKGGEEEICVEGVLEYQNDRHFGFLRSPENSYASGPDDIYVSAGIIQRYNLRSGDTISGSIRQPKEPRGNNNRPGKQQSERYFALKEVIKINSEDPKKNLNKVLFENLTPLHPNKKFTLERGDGSQRDHTLRMIDLISPIGKGQRGIIVAPPKSGKTVILQQLANSIEEKYPDCYLIVLLIDERPEEVTEMQRSVTQKNSEVVASTFDEPATRHVQVAEMAIEKAKRLVEAKKDVVILLDSMTRLARAYNTVIPHSGKILTGGVDANALQKPKRFFGAARNLEEGGSLTIIATALIDTGSKMDEVIYEEFKGTGNMELHLNREAYEKRIFPAVIAGLSGTRREDLLLTKDELAKTSLLRKYIHDLPPLEALELIINQFKLTDTNKEFYESMNKKK